MKYNLIGSNNILDPVTTVFGNRGIKNHKDFINLKENVTHDWKLLNNIEKAVDKLDEHLKGNSNIFIQIDEDFDGYASAAILYNYLKQLKPDVKIKWRTHNKKMHGIIPDTIPSDTGLLIIPDASSSEYKEHKQIQSRGIDIIILDHHEAKKESEYATVVNNQLSEKYPNKELSAGGVLYKFCQALDERYNVHFANRYLDLVAMSNIADSMSTKELETRYYIQQGLKNINNPLIKAIVKHNEYTLKGHVNIKSVSWTIAPTINATCRIGTVEDRENLFKALTGQAITHSKLHDGEEPLAGMARILSNIRGRQNTMRTKGEKAVNERIEKKGINDNKIIIVDATEIIEEPALNGVVAIKIAEKYKKPTLIIRESKDQSVFSGSARAYDAGVIKDLKDYLNDTGKFEFCEGHQGAFGLEIKRDNLVPMNNQINEELKNIESHTGSYDVDFAIPILQVRKSLIEELDSLKDVWGRGVEEPLIAVENITVNKPDIQLLGKNKNTIKFTSNGIEFMKFYTNEDEYKEWMNTGSSISSLLFTVVGRASINEFRGRRTPQIVIEDYVVKPSKSNLPF